MKEGVSVWVFDPPYTSCDWNGSEIETICRHYASVARVFRYQKLNGKQARVPMSLVLRVMKDGFFSSFFFLPPRYTPLDWNGSEIV